MLKDRYRKFLSTRTNWWYLVTVVLAVIGWVVCLFLEQISTKVIGSMFALIAIENIIIIINYMDDTRDKTSTIEKNVNYVVGITVEATQKVNILEEKLNQILDKTAVAKFDSKSCDYIELARSAKNSIFYNSTGLGFLKTDTAQKEFSEIDKNINITLVITDNCDSMNFLSVVTKGLCQVSSKEAKNARAGRESIIDRITENDTDIKISYIDFYAPISYFAIDYKEQTESSVIVAKHYLHNLGKKNLNAYFCIAKPGHFLYDIYLKQIVMLESCNRSTDEINNGGME